MYKIRGTSSYKEFEKLVIALNLTRSGFLYFTTVLTENQQEIVDDIDNAIKNEKITRPTKCFNCDKVNSIEGFKFVIELIKENPCTEAFVLFNFHLLSNDFPEFFDVLNFSRTSFSELKKLFVFGITKEFEKQCILYAPDFYSYFLTAFHFKSFILQSSSSMQMETRDNKIRIFPEMNLDKLMNNTK